LFTAGWQVPERHLYVGKVAFDPSGTRLAVSTGSRTVRIWAMSGPRRRSRTFTGRVANSFDVVRDIAFSPDGEHLAVAYSDGRLRVWNTRTGRQTAGLAYRRRMREEINALPPRNAGALAVTYTPDGTRIAVADRIPSISLWDPTTGRRLTRLGNPQLDAGRDMTALAVSPDGALLAGADFDHDNIGSGADLRLWDLPTEQSRSLRRIHTGVINQLAINPGGTLLASVANVDPVQLWYLPSGDHAATLAGHERSVRSVAFHPDGTVLATGSDDLTIRLWDLRSHL
jgi:WD40 repeat protein